MSTIIDFDADLFRAQFPNQFPNPPNTDEILELYWDIAICYISNNAAGRLTEDCRRQAINLMTAHLIQIADNATSGQQSGFVESASIDKISVKVQTFQNKNQFQWFLNQTPYGQQLYAMLFLATVGGFMAGAFNELGSFRRAGGVFSPVPKLIDTGDDMAKQCAILLSPPDIVNETLNWVARFDNNLTNLEPLAVLSCVPYALAFSVTGPVIGSDIIINAKTEEDVKSFANVTIWDSLGNILLQENNVRMFTGFSATIVSATEQDYILTITPVNSEGGTYQIEIEAITDASIVCNLSREDRPTPISAQTFPDDSPELFPVIVGGGCLEAIYSFESAREGDTSTIIITDALDPGGSYTFMYWAPGNYGEPASEVSGLVFSGGQLTHDFILGAVAAEDTTHTFLVVGDDTSVPVTTAPLDFANAATSNPIPTFSEIVGESLANQLNPIDFNNLINANRSTGAFSGDIGLLPGGSKLLTIVFDLSLDDLVGGFNFDVTALTQTTIANGFIYSGYDGSLIASAVGADLFATGMPLVIPESEKSGKFLLVIQPTDNRQTDELHLEASSEGGRLLLDHVTSRRISDFNVDFGTVDFGSDLNVNIDAETGFRRFYKLTSLSDTGPSVLNVKIANVTTPIDDSTVTISLWNRYPNDSSKFDTPPTVFESVEYSLLSGAGRNIALTDAAGSDGEIVFSIEADRSDIDWQNADISFSIDGA